MVKQSILNLIAIFVIVGCSNDLQEGQQIISYNTIADWDIEHDVSVNDSSVLYNPVSDSYVKKQQDPFAIDNVRAAYNNLTTLNKCPKGIQISATHYALRIYPKTRMELWELENMEEINVSYIPFNYEYCKEIISNYNTSNIYFERSPYFVEDERVCDGTNTVSKILYNLPILYVAWPIEKELPGKYNYKIDYEIFNPYYVKETDRTMKDEGLSQNIINEIIHESIRLSHRSGSVKAQQSADTFYRGVSGKIYYKDYTLNTTPYMHNIKIRLKLGSVSWETYTASDGTFNFRGEIPKEATYSMVFSHPKWKITGSEDSEEPLTYTYGTVEEVWGDTNYIRVAYKYSYRPIFEAHSAVNYFYNSNHEVPKYVITPGVRIVALKETSSSANGVFKRTKKYVPYILLYNNNRDQTVKVINTVLHELGHFTTFQHFNDLTNYTNYPRIFKESWAVYCGWYLTRKFYERYNYTESDGITSFVRNGQNWEQNSPADNYYSPLFIDLVDSYNQRTYNSAYNDDVIAGVPHSVVIDIGLNSQTWSTLKSRLNMYVGTYYSNSELAIYVEPYETWKTLNNVNM